MTDGLHWKETYLNEEGKMNNGTPETEHLFFAELAQQIRSVVTHFKEDNKGVKRRANHAKILAGFTEAVFRILPPVESTKDLYVGFFVPGKAYKTTVRFSNASAECVADDSAPDLRGVGLRIQTEGGEQDFLMTNAEPHHARDAREAMIAIRAGVERDVIDDKIPDEFPAKEALAGLVGALPFLVTHLGLRGFHMAGTLKKQMKRKVESLSTETFWSRAPLAIGNGTDPENAVAVKYRLRPVKVKPEQKEIIAEKDLENKIELELREGDVKFYFEVQRYKNAEDTPIEDSTKAWDTDFYPMAELIIPQNSKNEKEAVDGTVFNPWNLNATHFRPLGSMNRSRKAVYEASVDERNKRP